MVVLLSVHICSCFLRAKMLISARKLLESCPLSPNKKVLRFSRSSFWGFSPRLCLVLVVFHHSSEPPQRGCSSSAARDIMETPKIPSRCCWKSPISYQELQNDPISASNACWISLVTITLNYSSKPSICFFLNHKVENRATLAKMLHYSTVWHWILKLYWSHFYTLVVLF